MVDESCRVEPRTQLKIQDQQSDWETKECLKLVEEGTDNFIESGRWALLEEKYTMTSEERQENNARMRRNAQKQTSEIRQWCDNE